MKSVFTFLTIITSFLYIASLAMFVVAPEFVVLNISIFVMAFVLSLVIVFYKKNEVVLFLTSRLFKNLGREFVTLILVLSILGIINFLVFKNSVSIDVTKNKIHSLSEQTQKVLKSFQGKDLSFTLFAKRADWERYLKLLNMYETLRPSITIRVIDVDTEPALVAMNKISENGTLIIKYKKEEFRTILKDELALTNMLLKMTKPQLIKLYFSTGHNEATLDDESPEGMSYLASVLKNSSFQMSYHELKNKIPKDASVFIIQKPQLSFSDEEITNLKSYVEQGGSLVLTLAPQFDDIELSNLENYLKSIGVQYVNGIVLDRLSASQGGQASVPMVSDYPKANPITKGFQGRTLFPVSSFFQNIDSSNMKWNSMINSLGFPATWGETNFSEVTSGKATYNENIDYKGPLALALLGVNEATKSKVILFGSSAFVSNQFQGQANNFNLFLNSVSWAADEKSILSLNRPELKGNLIYISDIHFNLVFYFSILLFPLLFFGLGTYFYRKKLSR